jgi:2-dehydropantoate 2-reductase
MRIAVMGTGAMGGYVGARLATGGAEVSFIARGAHLEAIRRNGLKVTSPNGDMLIRPAKASDDPAAIGPVDLVLVAVKMYDMARVVEAVAPMVGDGTGVVTLQNGVEAPDMAARLYGAARTVGGVCMINAEIAGPGVIQHNALNAVILGELEGGVSERLRRFAGFGTRGGVEVKLSANIRLDLWRKMMLLSPLGCLSAMIGLPFSRYHDLPESWRLVEQGVREVAAVGRAQGLDLGEADIETAMHHAHNMKPTWKASLAVDRELGKRLEVEWFAGTICRLGEAAGIDTPMHSVALGVLKPHADGAARS